MELVNRQTAEELDEMKRIFSINEINKLTKKRSYFEYKINGVNKNIQDYKAYIQHEKELLKDVRLKRDKQMITDKKSSIEFHVMKRIKYIYEIAIHRFPNDYSLCLSYFKFCKTLNNTNAANLAVQHILKNYPDNPEVWKLAGKFYAYEKQDKNTAISVLLKGLTIHKDDQDLYKEAIELELTEVAKGNLAEMSHEETDKDKLVNNKIKNYMESIFNDINDLNFYINILELLETYPATTDVQNMIIDKLMESYSEEGLVWHTIAQRELNGLYYAPDSEDPPTVKLNLKRCFDRYEKGLKELTEEKRTPLWHYYLDCLIAMQGDRKIGSHLKTRTLQLAFENAYEENILTEKHYIVWIEILNSMLEDSVLQSKKDEYEKKINEVLEKGLESMPQSVELWKLRLKAAIMTDKESEVNIVLERGFQAIKDKAGPLWLMALRFHLLVSDKDKINKIYQSAIQEPGEVANIIKPQYIQWLGFYYDIEEVRNKYNTIAQSKPYCKELHFAMDVVEGNELNPNIDAWQKVHRNACNQFGKDDVDVWIAYAQFLSTHRSMELSEFYREVQSTLSPLLFPDFHERYLRLEEHKKLSADNPAEKMFKMLCKASTKKCWSEQNVSSDFIQD